MDDWKGVIWSDETKISKLWSVRRKCVQKKPGEVLSGRLIEPTLKFGRVSLMMQGLFHLGWGYIHM